MHNEEWEIWVSDGLQAVMVKRLKVEKDVVMQKALEISRVCTSPIVSVYQARREIGAWNNGVQTRGEKVVAE